MKNFLNLIIIMVLLGLPHAAEAQFYSVGDDPGRLKWYSIESPNCRIFSRRDDQTKDAGNPARI